MYAQKHQKSSVVDLDAIMLTSYIMFCLIMPLAQQHKKKMGVDVISHSLLFASGFLRGKGHCMASRLLIETLVFSLVV